MLSGAKYSMVRTSTNAYMSALSTVVFIIVCEPRTRLHFNITTSLLGNSLKYCMLVRDLNLAKKLTLSARLL